MPRAVFPAGYSLGLEVECEDILSYDAQKGLDSNRFHVTHDASIETDVSLSSAGVYISNNIVNSPERRESRMVTGTEIVSEPIDLEEVNPLQLIKDLTLFLADHGESMASYRAAIHIHIGMPVNLIWLKRAVILGRHLEHLFFHLAGNGYMFRGVYNDAAYCRPITRLGPPCVETGVGIAKSFDCDDLLESETTKDFWYRYGQSNYSSPTRYVPQRYTWLNFYSLLAHGTLEFRPWNKTLNPNFIMAEAELCQRFCLSVMKGDYLPKEENSVFDSISLGKDTSHRLLYEIAEPFELSPWTFKILEDILRITPICSLPEYASMTHITQSRIWGDGSYIPKKVEKVVKPNIVTIHTLRGEANRP